MWSRRASESWQELDTEAALLRTAPPEDNRGEFYGGTNKTSRWVSALNPFLTVCSSRAVPAKLSSVPRLVLTAKF